MSTGEQDFVTELVNMKIETPEDAPPGQLRKRDELYESAIEVVVREGRGSVSLLQRTLGIGYGRAARLIDFMAEDGLVGTYAGSQAREVLITMDDWERMQGEQPAEPAREPVTAKPRSNRLRPSAEGWDGPEEEEAEQTPPAAASTRPALRRTRAAPRPLAPPENPDTDELGSKRALPPGAVRPGPADAFEQDPYQKDASAADEYEDDEYEDDAYEDDAYEDDEYEDEAYEDDEYEDDEYEDEASEDEASEDEASEDEEEDEESEYDEDELEADGEPPWDEEDERYEAESA